MRSVEDVVGLILQRFRKLRVSQVPGYNSFGYVKETDSAVIVSREKGQDTRIPFLKLGTAVSAVRQDSSVYDEGPSRLRAYGITHINSPVWSLLHLLTKGEILE